MEHIMYKKNFSPRRQGTANPALLHQRGFNLIEVMVALLVLSLGLAGIAALLLQGMTTSNAASHNSIAVAQAQTGVEMMRANLDAYTQGWFAGLNTADDVTAPVACGGSCADSRDQAANDYATWRDRLAIALPDGRGYLCTDSTPDDGQPDALDCDGNGTNVVKIFWRDIKDPDTQAAANESEFQRFVTTVSP